MNFKQIIADKGLKQSFVAKGIDVSEALLSMYLNGKRNMPEKIKELLTLFLMEV